MTAHDPGVRDALPPVRTEVLELWRRLVFDSYPEETARFFRTETDGFKNPVGQTIRRATERILDGALLGRDGDGVAEAIESIVRIRAVQAFSPSEAVGFVFLLKRAVREVLERALPGGLPDSVRSDLEDRVDALALSAFEIYTHCREQVVEIRVREAQRRTAALLERFNRETPADGPGDTAVAARRRKKGVEG